MRILNLHCVFFGLVVLGVLCPFPKAWAQENRSLQLSEQKIEAGLIYNLLKYTGWPKDKEPKAGGSTIVCILGTEDPFNGFLQPIEERTVKQHNIRLRHVSSNADMGECHLLFISATEKQRWAGLRQFLTDKHVLTVGDFSGFADEGGMIEFGVKESHIYIELNVKTISDAGLIVYSNLRRLSMTTHPPTQK